MGAEHVRVVHAADIHLDSPMRGLGSLRDADLAASLRLSTRRAFDALVRHCLATHPAALVIAGDLYDGDWKDYATGAYFVAGMADLDEAGIQVVIARGNHDAESVIRRVVSLPPNVHVLDADAPETVVLDDLGLAFHGQSFPTRAVRTNLAQRYPDPVPGLCNVGVLHTSVAGYAGHDPYAPCDLADLTGRGYEYFALGHVHAREVLATGAHTVAFSGNVQGRHIGETGPKGALSVTLRAGHPADLELVALDVARWEVADVVADGVSSMDDLLPKVRGALDDLVAGSGGRFLVAEVRITATETFICDPERLDAEVRALGASRHVGIKKVTAEVRADGSRTALGTEQRRHLREVIAGSDPQALLADADVAALWSELGYDYLRPAGLDLRDAAELASLFADAARELEMLADGGLL